MKKKAQAVKPSVRAPVVMAPPKIVPKRRKVTQADTVDASDTSLLVSIDLKRQTQQEIENIEIEEGQRFFPYAVLARLLVGWVPVEFISSFELKVTPDYPLPQIVVRFVEKMTEEDIAQMDPALKAQVQSHIQRVRQYPFVRVESPLLPKG